MRTNAHERYLAGGKKRTEIPGENEVREESRKGASVIGRRT